MKLPKATLIVEFEDKKLIYEANKLSEIIVNYNWNQNMFFDEYKVPTISEIELVLKAKSIHIKNIDKITNKFKLEGIYIWQKQDNKLIEKID